MACISAFAEPVITSWYTDEADQFAEVREQTDSTPVTTWPAAGLPNQNNGGAAQNAAVYSDVQRIAYDANFVYIESSGLSSHIMGPWYNANGNLFGRWPLDRGNMIRITRNPQPLGSDLTPLGSMGVFVNGAAMYNMLDAFSYQNASNRDQSNNGGNPGDGVWNRNAEPAEGPTFDPAGAHQPASGAYHYHITPLGLRAQLGDHVSYNAVTDSYSEDMSALTHSPLIGWAFDGYPVYGPYGYGTAMDPASPVRRIVSGYVVRDGANGTTDLTTTGRTTIPQWAADAYGTTTTLAAGVHGPNVTANGRFAMGWYTEDYDHLGDTGNPAGLVYDLDRHNGRMCVTPEFPGGTYAYFTTVDAAGNPAFPFIVGRTYYGDRIRNLQGGIPAGVTEYFSGGAAPDYLDTILPIITLSGGSVSVLQGEAYVEPGFVPSDDVDCLTIDDVSVTPSPFSTAVPGTFTLTYSVTDTAGNMGTATRTVSVTPNSGPDTTPPVITLVGGTVSLTLGDAYVEPGVNALDNIDGDLSAAVSSDAGTVVNTAIAGVYTITYSVSDAAGNPASATRTVVVTPPASGGGAMNVLFLSIDDLKPPEGLYDPITPNLDAFAASGVRFSKAFAQWSVCGPSRVSLMTGMRPDTLDIWGNDAATDFRDLHPGIVTLPQHFSENGYRSHGIGKLFHSQNSRSNDAGASWTDGHESAVGPHAYYEGTPTSGNWLDSDNGMSSVSATDVGEFNYRVNPPEPVTDSDYGDGVSADKAISWLQIYAADYVTNDQPFFLGVGFNATHLPFVAPKSYWDLYDPASLDLSAYTGTRDAPVNGRNYTRPAFAELTNYGDFSALPTVDEARHLIHGYMAASSYVDAQVGRVLDELDALGPDVANNTAVVIWSDHGWHLGDHGAFWTKNSTFHEANHAVMMMRIPGVSSAGTVVDQPVELIDMFPTLVDVAGLPEVVQPQGGLEGASLRKLLSGSVTDFGEAEGAYYEFSKNLGQGGGTGMGWSIHTRDFRYTEWYQVDATNLDQRVQSSPDFVELYDHRTDPDELVNVAGDAAYAGVVSDLAAQLDVGEGWSVKQDPPVLTLTGGAVLHPQGSPWVDPGFSAMDNQDGDLTAAVVENSAIALNVTVPGVYTITYEVCDSTAISVMETREVTVVAVNTAPTIVLNGGPMTLIIGEPFVDPGAMANDAEDGDLTASITSSVSGLGFMTPGTNVVTYEVVDSGLLMASVTRLVVVTDGDADGDGIPSLWELSYGMNPASAVGADGGTMDMDGDGVDNFGEYVMDSDPTDGSSYLRILNIEIGNLISFPSSVARVYTVQWTPSLVEGTWEDIPGLIVVPGVPGTADVMVVGDPIVDRPVAGYYRVQVEVP